MEFVIAGLIYSVIFWVLALKYPSVALLLIFASAPFQNDVSGGGPVKFSIAEVNLLLSVPIFFLRGRPIRFGPLGIPVLGYLSICLLACLLNWRSTSFISLVQIALYYGVAVMIFASFVKSETEYRLAFDGLIVVCVFLAVVGIVSGSNYYFGLHKNGVGASLASGLVVGVEMLFSSQSRRRKKFYALSLGVITCGLLLSLSRGAWVAAIVGLIAIFLMRRQFQLMLKAACIIVPLIAVSWLSLPEEQKDYALGFDRKSYSINARYINIELFKEHFERNRILGSGVGLRKEIDATNVVWLTLAETGIVGLISLLFIQVVFVSAVWSVHFGLNQRSMLFSVVTIAVALVLGRFVHGMFDHYWGRGPILLAWASAGMAINAWYSTKRRRRQRSAATSDESSELCRFSVREC